MMPELAALAWGWALVYLPFILITSSYYLVLMTVRRWQWFEAQASLQTLLFLLPGVYLLWSIGQLWQMNSVLSPSTVSIPMLPDWASLFSGLLTTPVVMGFFVVWLLGAAVLLVRYSFSQFMLTRRLSRTPLTFNRETLIHHKQLLQIAAARVGLTRVPRLRYLTDSNCPFVFGVWRPTIVLCNSQRGLNDAQLLQHLVHECTHIKRRDPLRLWLQLWVNVFAWPTVIVFWASRYHAELRELQCDRAVIENPHNSAAQYRASLHALARAALEGRGDIPSEHVVCSAGGAESAMLRRLERLGGYADSQSGSHVGRTLALVTCVLVAFSCHSLLAGSVRNALLKEQIERAVANQSQVSIKQLKFYLASSSH